MKKLLLLVLVSVIFMAGCGKEEQGCTPVSPASEESTILTYATANGITAEKDANGLYYQIVDTGTGVKPTINSVVTANYVGKLLNNTVFDQSTEPVPFELGRVIEGWQLGLQHIRKGGKIKLIIPSALAYGCIVKRDIYGNVAIPANSVLYFDVTIVDVQ